MAAEKHNAPIGVLLYPYRLLFFLNVFLWSSWHLKGVRESFVARHRGLAVAWWPVLFLFGLRLMFTLTVCTRLTRCRPAGREIIRIFQRWAAVGMQPHTENISVLCMYTHMHISKLKYKRRQTVQTETDESMCTHTQTHAQWEHPTSSEASSWNGLQLNNRGQTDTHTHTHFWYYFSIGHNQPTNSRVNSADKYPYITSKYSDVSLTHDAVRLKYNRQGSLLIFL